MNKFNPYLNSQNAKNILIFTLNFGCCHNYGGSCIMVYSKTKTVHWMCSVYAYTQYPLISTRICTSTYILASNYIRSYKRIHSYTRFHSCARFHSWSLIYAHPLLFTYIRLNLSTHLKWKFEIIWYFITYY